MSRETAASSLRPRRGQIYRDVHARRLDEQEVIDEAHLEQAWMEGGDACFASADARRRAFDDGVFLLRIPHGLDLRAADEFSGQFFAGGAESPYGRFRDVGPECIGDPLLGFHRRANQIEQFLLERRFWREHYPPAIAALGEALTRLSRGILRAVLSHVAIPLEDWSEATGGCSHAGGSYHLTFTHYQPDRGGPGLSSHKDDGFVTILRATEPGLEVNRRDRWQRAPADPGFFVISFGLSMEILTAGCAAPVVAIMHRVSHQDRHRSSFGHFASSVCVPGTDRGIYRYDPACGLQRACSSRQLIVDDDHEIYHGTDGPQEETR